jgi:hypothetical protein
MDPILTLSLFAISVIYAAASRGAIETADTKIQISTEATGLRVSKLTGPSSTFNWAVRDSRAPDVALIDHAFLKGKRVPIGWQLTGTAYDVIAHSLIFHFASAEPHLELTSTWQGGSGPGPVMHRIEIKNQSGEDVVLPRQTSLSLGLQPTKGHRITAWWVEKSAGMPTHEGTHADPVASGYRKVLISTPYSEDNRRDPIPWCSLHDETLKSGVYFGIAFSGLVSLDVSASTEGQMAVDAGIAPEADGAPAYTTRLQPGETFSAPPVFLGCYSGSVDDGANRMRTWLRQSICQHPTSKEYPLLTLNSWGSGMAIDDKLAKSMSEKAADLGLEMFHVDAGWFRQVGDWRSSPQKFPKGLRALSDDVHRLGLKFGLWVGWTQAGIGDESEDPSEVLSAFSSGRQSWIAEPRQPGWKPEDFTGTTICLAPKPAQDWCEQLLDSIIEKFNIDMLEHDQLMVVQNCVHEEHSHTAAHSDIAYRAAQGYYSVYDRLRKRHPNLLFEDCVNGGRMVDFGVLSRASYISISDTYTPTENRQAFYDNVYAIPAAMCECYVSDREPVHSIGEFVSMLRSGMMGWFTLMQNPVTWTPDQCKAAKRQFDVYKTRLRPLILSGNVFHASERPDGLRWDGIQFAGQDRLHSALFAFRGSQAQASHRFPLCDLDPHATYLVEFEDGGISSYRETGAKLMKDGLEVSLSDPKSSQLVFLTRQ